jgi:hypothetical protein
VPRTIGCPSPPLLVATNQSATWEYRLPGALVEFPGAAVPFTSLANNWSQLETFSLQQLCIPGSLVQAGSAGHICSYNCWLSKFVGDKSNLCWLNPSQDPPEGATRCPLGGPPPERSCF